MLIAPLEDDRYETRPKPLGFCLPNPGMPPTEREEKIVGRGAGSKAAPRDSPTGASSRRGAGAGVEYQP
jgi:hypothetical protein